MLLKHNLVANYLGQGWTALMGLIFLPQYIVYLGMEAYGLIGFFAVLQTWLTLLDMGMTPTLNREIARYAAGARTAESIRDLVHTVEVICIGLGALILLAIALAAEWLADQWLNERTLLAATVAQSIALMGLVAALRFVEGVYRGAMLGMQRHVWLNAVTSTFATVRAVGALLILAYVQPSIQAFFFWQALVSAAMLVTVGAGVHRHLPDIRRPAAFTPVAFSDAWAFAGGVFATTMLALLTTQIDKIILSRMLSLELFGVYAFSWAVAGGLFVLIAPVAQTFYPRFSELVARGDDLALAAAYHEGARLMTVIVVPAAMLLIAFGKPLLTAWTANESLSEQASSLVAVLSLGTMLNGCMHVPYMLQLASGWSMLAVWANLVAALLLVPTIVWIVPIYGPTGAAWVWVSVNAGYLIFAIHFMHTRLLPQEKVKWYLFDIFTPAAAAAAVIVVAHILKPAALRGVISIAWIAIAGCLAYGAALLSVPAYRRRIWRAV